MQYDITMIGHVCKDTLEDMGQISHSLGGAVYYSSIAAARSGSRIHVVTKASLQDDLLMDVMRKNGVEVTRLDDDKTTEIKLIYDSPDRERRQVILEQQAEPFATAGFPASESRIYHMAGLFKGEIPDDFIPFLAERGEVAMDVQGVLRCSEEGNLVFRNWELANEYLPRVTYLKTDAAEAEILTGLKDREAAARELAAKGVREVMITHNEEVLLLAEGKMMKAPFNPANLSGRTGRGDTTFAAYLSKRLEAGPYESLFYAAALCSIKMESPGPYLGGISEVYKRMEQIGYRQ